ncbi:MAG: DNA starvation/stationary phase protection protein Dps [Geitlerinemataceae cyanobacterium]
MQALVNNTNNVDSPRMTFHATRIDIPEDTRRQVAESLNQTLATTLDLKTQVKQAHWTVKGMDFFQLHELFDQMASQLEEYVDMVAERITALGGTPLGTARMAAQESILPEYPLTIISSKDHVTALADRFAAYAKSLREGANLAEELKEMDTNDLYIEVSRTIDKYLWFLEAHLQGHS